jgi:hypothetical protein
MSRLREPAAKKSATAKRRPSRLTHWLLEHRIEDVKGPGAREGEKTHSWWQVVCLTGVDYFSTLGYIPGIAIIAAGALSPLATLLIVLLTLFGMLPVYRQISYQSPHGQGSIAMLERLLSFWGGKLFVLVLLGFVATAWLITITLSAADATAHIVENPFVPTYFEGETQKVLLTLALLALLGAVFLKGFKEAIGIAVFIVAAYLSLNLVVIVVGMYDIVSDPGKVGDWRKSLVGNYGSPVAMIVASFLVFPRLALGLSGFETGVSMMPLVRGEPDDDPERPEGRIRNTNKMLMVAALIMSFYLLATSFITAILIPYEEVRSGEANGRALAYLAHEHLGDAFGTVYDLSTITILWFAGASAMAGLLNIVPRYLPRYGMAPEWGRAVRPLVIVYTVIACVITYIFGASVDAQSGAYATGVLAMMTSAAIAVTISAHRRGARGATIVFGIVSVIVTYAAIANMYAQPGGIQIALFFIAAIILISLVSRVSRSTELRTESIEIDATARKFIDDAAKRGEIHLVAHRRRTGSAEEYASKEREQREDNHIPAEDLILFLEVEVEDASEFANVLQVRGVQVGEYEVLRAVSSTVPNAIAALLLHLRDTTGKKPHCYFGWTEGNPVVYLLRYILFGEGDTAPVTREVLREAESDPKKRPAIHVGG